MLGYENIYTILVRVIHSVVSYNSEFPFNLHCCPKYIFEQDIVCCELKMFCHLIKKMCNRNQVPFTKKLRNWFSYLTIILPLKPLRRNSPRKCHGRHKIAQNLLQAIHCIHNSKLSKNAVLLHLFASELLDDE